MTDGITESKSFHGLTYTKRKTARSLGAARKYAKQFRERGYPHVHIEKIKVALYVIYTHGRAVRGRK